jgi:hypothetical protein
MRVAPAARPSNSTETQPHFSMHFSHGTSVSGPTGGVNCGLDAHPSVCAGRTENLPRLLGIFPGMKVSPYSSTLAQTIWKRNLDVVWFGMRSVPPQSGYIELAEWSNRAVPLADYTGTQPIGDHMTVRQHGSRTTVFVLRDGTAYGDC